MIRVHIYLKGIVSGDLHICFWYHSIDLKLLHLMERVRLLFKFHFPVENF
jgi:hypothetical protein